jgi:hypothetical protein
MLSKHLVAIALILATLATPAQALGRNERNVLKGIAAAVIIGARINESRKSKARAAAVPQAPLYQPPQYQPPRTQKPGRVIGRNRAIDTAVYVA